MIDVKGTPSAHLSALEDPSVVLLSFDEGLWVNNNFQDDKGMPCPQKSKRYSVDNVPAKDGKHPQDA